MRRRLALRAARLAGTLIRWRVHLMLPGLAGAALVSLGGGELAGQAFGRGVALWASLALAGVFVLVFAAEVNRAPRTPRQSPTDQ